MQQPLVDESADLNRSAGEEQLDEPPGGEARRGGGPSPHWQRPLYIVYLPGPRLGARPAFLHVPRRLPRERAVAAATMSRETVAAALDEREGAARRSEGKERERGGGRRVSRAVTRMQGQSGAAGAESGSGEKQQRWRWEATEGARGRRSRWAWFAHRE